jgi:cellobiose-specific phosphotransferase system component IIB
MGNEADAARCDFSKSAWRGMRDAALLANAREVIRVAEGLLAGPHADTAAECGITAVSVAACKKEADDYEAVLTAPQQSIATRKALTAQLRERFNAVEKVFTSLDGLVEQFSDKTFVAGYHAARTVRDLGHGPVTEPTPAPPAPPP